MPWDLLTESVVILWDYVVSVSYRSCSRCAQWSASRIYRPGGRSLFRAQGSALKFTGSAPAAGSDAHASLCTFGPLAVTFWLALSTFGTAYRYGWCGGRGLWRDGAQKVIALPQEVATAAQPETAFPEDHASAAGLGGSRSLIVLQLGKMSRVSIGDELWRESDGSVRVQKNLWGKSREEKLCVKIPDTGIAISLLVSPQCRFVMAADQVTCTQRCP